MAIVIAVRQPTRISANKIRPLSVQVARLCIMIIHPHIGRRELQATDTDLWECDQEASICGLRRATLSWAVPLWLASPALSWAAPLWLASPVAGRAQHAP